MKLCQFLLVCFAALALASAASAGHVVLQPTDDMYTDPENHGPHQTEVLMTADLGGCQNHHERIAMKFDLSSIELIDIDNATLSIYRWFRCPTHYYTNTNFYAITQDWDEDTWNYLQHHPHGSYVWQNYLFGPQIYVWFHIDITDLVQAWVDEEIDNYGLVIQALPGERWSKFHSKDYWQEQLRPFLTVDYTGTAVEDPFMPEPTRLVLENPSACTATIKFILEGDGPVLVDVYDMLGRRVRRLVNDRRTAGEYDILWDGRNGNHSLVSPGVYFCMLRTANGAVTKKLSVLR